MLLPWLLPTVLSGVIGAEQALHGATGQTKRTIVLNVIQAGAKAVGQTDIPDAQAVGGLIDAVVEILKAAGVFKSAVVPQTTTQTDTHPVTPSVVQAP